MDSHRTPKFELLWPGIVNLEASPLISQPGEAAPWAPVPARFVPEMSREVRLGREARKRPGVLL